MKRLVIALGIIAVILGTAIVSLLILREACDILTQHTDNICASIDAGNFEEAFEQAQQLDNYWQEHKGMLSYFFRRHQISDISNSIALLKGLIRHQDTSQAAASCEEVAHQINELWQSELPLPSSVL